LNRSDDAGDRQAIRRKRAQLFLDCDGVLADFGLHPIILTGCPIGGWAEPQKVEWAAEHFPVAEIITCMSREKYLHVDQGDVLVDDYRKYQRQREEAGGIFIHHTSARSIIAALKRIGLLNSGPAAQR
jgi:hypothetical protein